MNERTTTVTVRRGNAVDPRVIVAVETFHTEFAARLFGWLFCRERDQYHYWTI